MFRYGIGSVVGLLVLSGCTGTAGADPPPGRDDASAARVTDCGTFVLSQGQQLATSAIDCFIEAVHAARPARLKVTQPTTEGDPIPVTYTADGNGTVRVKSDARQDKFGSRKIEYATCTEPTTGPGGLDFAHCSDS